MFLLYCVSPELVMHQPPFQEPFCNEVPPPQGQEAVQGPCFQTSLEAQNSHAWMIVSVAAKDGVWGPGGDLGRFKDIPGLYLYSLPLREHACIARTECHHWWPATMKLAVSTMITIATVMIMIVMIIMTMIMMVMIALTNWLKQATFFNQELESARLDAVPDPGVGGGASPHDDKDWNKHSFLGCQAVHWSL